MSVYLCPPSWTSLPLPTPSHPSRLSQSPSLHPLANGRSVSKCVSMRFGLSFFTSFRICQEKCVLWRLPVLDRDPRGRREGELLQVIHSPIREKNKIFLVIGCWDLEVVTEQTQLCTTTVFPPSWDHSGKGPSKWLTRSVYLRNGCPWNYSGPDKSPGPNKSFKLGVSQCFVKCFVPTWPLRNLNKPISGTSHLLCTHEGKSHFTLCHRMTDCNIKGKCVVSSGFMISCLGIFNLFISIHMIEFRYLGFRWKWLNHSVLEKSSRTVKGI